MMKTLGTKESVQNDDNSYNEKNIFIYENDNSMNSIQKRIEENAAMA